MTDRRPLPPQDLDPDRVAAARDRREAEASPSLAEEATAHERSLPAQRKPGDDERPTDESGSDIARDASRSARSAAQVGKPLPQTVRRD